MILQHLSHINTLAGFSRKSKQYFWVKDIFRKPVIFVRCHHFVNCECVTLDRVCSVSIMQELTTGCPCLGASSESGALLTATTFDLLEKSLNSSIEGQTSRDFCLWGVRRHSQSKSNKIVINPSSDLILSMVQICTIALQHYTSFIFPLSWPLGYPGIVSHCLHMFFH